MIRLIIADECLTNVAPIPTVISLRPNYTMRYYKTKEIGDSSTSLKV